MAWYAAHVIMYVKFKDGVQDKYPVWENIHLIEADSEDLAFEKAASIGKSSEGDASGTFFWEERSAIMLFAGIRKVVTCDDADQRPGDGTEVTYNELTLNNEETFLRFIDGQSAGVVFEDV